MEIWDQSIAESIDQNRLKVAFSDARQKDLAQPVYILQIRDKYALKGVSFQT